MFKRRKNQPGKTGDNPLASRVVRGDDRPTEPLETDTVQSTHSGHGRRTPDPEATVQVAPTRHPARGTEPATRLVAPPDASEDRLDTDDHLPVGVLLVLRGPNQGSLLPVGPAASDLGSGDQTTIPSGAGTSQGGAEGHAVLTYEGGQRRFILQASEGGRVFVDGQAIREPTELRDGAHLRIGSSEFLFRTLIDAHVSDSRSP